MNNIYNTYDDIAYFYNKYWTVRPQKLMTKALDAIFLPRLKQGAHLLDICCGTGNIASVLYKKGYKVTGLDGSRLMLDYGEKNAPSVEFIHGDARNFDIRKQFDGITCLFDSINHILKIEEVGLVFQNVYRHLKKNGIFVFDINSLKSSEEASDMDFFAVNDDEVFTIRCDFNDTSEITSYRSTFFIKEGGLWRRGDAIVEEKYHAPESLVQILKDTGFSGVSFADGSSFGIKDFEDRLFFFAEKGGG